MEDQSEVFQEANKPRKGFLLAASIVSVLAALSYIYEEKIIDESGAIGFAVILVFLVLLALFLVLCYRSPRIGNRLLGYDVAMPEPKHKAKSDFQYSAGFKADTGIETKRMNSRRKQARYSRRKYAETTRAMRKEKLSDDAPKSDE